MNNHQSTPLFVCAQTGARRAYAVPSIFAAAGMLERFYTDLAGNIGFGKILTLGKHVFGKRSMATRLAGRKIPANTRHHSYSLAGPDIRRWLRKLWSPSDSTSGVMLEVQRSNELGTAATRKGFGKATHLYTMMDELTPLKVAAKARGLTVVSEIYILVSTNRILREERLRFPEWEPSPPDLDRIRKETLPENSLFHCVDYYVCPSKAVADDLISNWCIPQDRIILIPYGMDPKWLELEPRTCTGRVLFAGSAELRKGIHYLAMAAKALREKGRNYEFRVAGNVTPQVRNHPLCRDLTFLGRIPRTSIHQEFQSADIFVLPTLAEGSAEVTYEALASGLPIVTTNAAGSVARDGIEGRIVLERDAISLANAIDEIVQNRPLRDQFAHAARQRARLFTWERYGERLVAGMRSMKTPDLE